MKMSLKNINNISAMLFLVSIMVIPRSFIFIKLSFLIAFLLSHILTIYRINKFKFYPQVIIFYSAVALLGSIWAIIGYINEGSVSGIVENFRLWFFWSFAYGLIITILVQDNKIEVMHRSIVLSGLLISLINLFEMFEFYNQLGIVPDSILTEMDMRIGFHDGYVQVTSHNIGSLLFIVPYLIAFLFIKKQGNESNRYPKISLLFCFILAVLSGRRALWLCVLMTPMLIMIYSIFARTTSRLSKTFKIAITLFICSISIGALTLFVFSSSFSEIPTVQHLMDAFSAEDERSIQKGFLINSFKESPILGSGFGGFAGYARSQLQPWLYELTYYQLLFNFGIIGMAAIILVFIFYLYLITKKITQNICFSKIQFCIMIGFFAFLIGAYSNPYFLSFDFLIYIAMLPFLAAYRTESKELIIN